MPERTVEESPSLRPSPNSCRPHKSQQQTGGQPGRGGWSQLSKSLQSRPVIRLCPAGSRNQLRGQKRCWRKPEREAGASLSSCTATGQCPVLSPGPGCGQAASPPRVQFTAEEAAEAEEETQVSVGLRRQRGGVSACPSSLGTSVGRWPPLQLPPHPAIHLDISAPCCPSAAPPEVTCDVLGVDISGQDARPCFAPLHLRPSCRGSSARSQAARQHMTIGGISVHQQRARGDTDVCPCTCDTVV